MLVINNAFSAFHLKGAVRYFSSKGWEVCILSTPGELVDRLAAEEGGRVIPIELEREISPFRDIRSLKVLLRILRREKPDVINVGSPKTGFLFACAKFLKPSLPMIFTLRGIRSDTLTGWKRRVVFVTEKFTCRMADKVIVISPSLRDHAARTGMLNPTKSLVFGEGSSNGIDTVGYARTDETQALGRQLRSDLSIPSEASVICSVGRITRDKGIEELFKAFEQIGEQDSGVHWILAGPVEEGDPVDSSILDRMRRHPRIHMLGQVSPIHKVYAASDILVQASHREGFGNVVLQASSMELPVIVARIPGLMDTTVDGLTGRYVTPADVGELATAIGTYIADPELRRKHGQAGRKRAVESFQPVQIWKAQEDLYHSVLNNRRE